MTDPCDVLKINNDQICSCIKTLKNQRDELNELILKQSEERETLQGEMDRVTYKLSLVNKSLNQRIATRSKYDETIRQAEIFYKRIADSSSQLLGNVQKHTDVLLETIDKKVGTEVSKPAHFSTVDATKTKSELGIKKFPVTRGRSLSLSYEASASQMLHQNERFTIKDVARKNKQMHQLPSELDEVESLSDSSLLAEGSMYLPGSHHTIGF